MKAVLTLVLVIVSGATALANNGKVVKEMNPLKSYVQTESFQMDTYLEYGIIVASVNSEVNIADKKSIARLYKFKNSRVKKALTFTTKRNRAKMA